MNKCIVFLVLFFSITSNITVAMDQNAQRLEQQRRAQQAAQQQQQSANNAIRHQLGSNNYIHYNSNASLSAQSAAYWHNQNLKKN